MITAYQCIQSIMDAASKDDFTAAEKALNDYADQRNGIVQTHLLENHSLMNLEEERSAQPQRERGITITSTPVTC